MHCSPSLDPTASHLLTPAFPANSQGTEDVSKRAVEAGRFLGSPRHFEREDIADVEVVKREAFFNRPQGTPPPFGKDDKVDNKVNKREAAPEAAGRSLFFKREEASEEADKREAYGRPPAF